MAIQQGAATGASIQWGGPALGISLEGNLRQSPGPQHPQPAAAQAQSGFRGSWGPSRRGSCEPTQHGTATSSRQGPPDDHAVQEVGQPAVAGDVREVGEAPLRSRERASEHSRLPGSPGAAGHGTPTPAGWSQPPRVDGTGDPARSPTWDAPSPPTNPAVAHEPPRCTDCPLCRAPHLSRDGGGAIQQCSDRLICPPHDPGA